MDPTLKAQLKQVVTYAAPSGVDVSGQTTVGSTATLWARVEPQYREFSVNGTVERTTHIMIFDENFPMTEYATREAQFWIPATTSYAAADEARRPKLVTFCFDERGRLDHVELAV